MPTITVSVRTKFPEVTAKIRANAALAIAKGATDIEAHAKALAPVDTGLLRNSIHSEQKGELEWEVESPVHYSVYQEYGTSRMAPQPFMTPASEMVRPKLAEAFRRLA